MYHMYQIGDCGGIEFLGMDTIPYLGILPLLLWILAWKGWALWLAARRSEMMWFVVLLIFNIIGLLEIFYIFAVAKKSDKKETTDMTDDLGTPDHVEKKAN